MLKNRFQNSKLSVVWILSVLLYLQPGLVAADDLLVDLASDAKSLGVDLETVAEEPEAEPAKVEENNSKQAANRNEERSNDDAKQAEDEDLESDDSGFAKTSDKSWGYGYQDGALHWAKLSAENQLCKTGKAQSPINIVNQTAVNTQGMPGLDIAYREVPLRLKKTAQNLVGEYPLGSYVELGGKRFEFTKYQFKTPSEHQIDGFAYPMEIQLFHQDGEKNHLIISLLVMEGEANEPLQTILNSVPKEQDQLVVYEKRKFNPAVFLPKELSFYRYLGSLTEPPCTENVVHLVFRTPIYASVGQLIAANRLLGDNVRPVQPHNGRLVLKSWSGKINSQAPATRPGYYFDY